MFFVRIDAPNNRNVIGFESGTRAEFDQRRAGDPQWVFVDADVVRAGVKIDHFLRNPTAYVVTERAALKKKPRIS